MEECYGIPYTMHTQDIERLERVSFWARNPDEGTETPYRNMVNIRLTQGWEVLWVGNDADNESLAIMGVPRPQYCTDTGWAKGHPASTLKYWDHTKKKWECRWCEELQADFENDRIEMNNYAPPEEDQS